MMDVEVVAELAAPNVKGTTPDVGLSTSQALARISFQRSATKARSARALLPGKITSADA